jgi:hypothetical protein
MRNFPERIYTNKTRFNAYYLNEIYILPQRTVLISFFPIQTEAKGDRFYQIILIALIRNGSLATAIKFATVVKIIEFKVPLKTSVTML